MCRKKLILMGVLLPLGGCTLSEQRPAHPLPAPAAASAVTAYMPPKDVPGPVVAVQHSESIDGGEPLVQAEDAHELIPGPPGAQPAGEGLTLEELESLAVANNPAVAEMHARIDALRGRWVQAGLPFNPVAQYQADEIGSDDAQGLHSLGVSQTVVTAGKLQLRQAVIAAEIRRAEANLAADRLRIATDVRTAFTAALVAQRRLELVEQLLEIAVDSVESVDQMLQAAEVSRVPLLQAQTELQQTELALQTAEAALTGARRQLASVAGVPALPPKPLVGDLEEELPEVPYDDAINQLLAASPEMADRAAAVERARRSLRLACAQVVPNVTAQVGVGYDTGANDPFTGVQISLPLPVVDRNQGNIRRARAEISAAALAHRRTELSLANRLARALQEYQTARLRVLRLTNNVAPKAQETLELSRLAFQAGEVGYLQLLTAQRTLFQVRLDTLAAVEEARQAAARIGGFLLDGSLAPTSFAPTLD